MLSEASNQQAENSFEMCGPQDPPTENNELFNDEETLDETPEEPPMEMSSHGIPLCPIHKIDASNFCLMDNCEFPLNCVLCVKDHERLHKVPELNYSLALTLNKNLADQLFNQSNFKAIDYKNKIKGMIRTLKINVNRECDNLERLLFERLETESHEFMLQKIRKFLDKARDDYNNESNSFSLLKELCSTFNDFLLLKKSDLVPKAETELNSFQEMVNKFQSTLELNFKYIKGKFSNREPTKESTPSTRLSVSPRPSQNKEQRVSNPPQQPFQKKQHINMQNQNQRQSQNQNQNNVHAHAHMHSHSHVNENRNSNRNRDQHVQRNSNMEQNQTRLYRNTMNNRPQKMMQQRNENMQNCKVRSLQQSEQNVGRPQQNPVRQHPQMVDPQINFESFNNPQNGNQIFNEKDPEMFQTQQFKGSFKNINNDSAQQEMSLKSAPAFHQTNQSMESGHNIMIPRQVPHKEYKKASGGNRQRKNSNIKLYKKSNYHVEEVVESVIDVGGFSPGPRRIKKTRLSYTPAGNKQKIQRRSLSKAPQSVHFNTQDEFEMEGFGKNDFNNLRRFPEPISQIVQNENYQRSTIPDYMQLGHSRQPRSATPDYNSKFNQLQQESNGNQKYDAIIETKKRNHNSGNGLLTSKILVNPNDQNFISESIFGRRVGLDLLFRGSRDGFSSQIFHKKCDGRGPTIVIAKSKQSNKVFGGYSEFSWSNQMAEETNNSMNSFLFSVDEKQTFRLSGNNNTNSVCYFDHRGPVFGKFNVTVEGRLYYNYDLCLTVQKEHGKPNYSSSHLGMTYCQGRGQSATASDILAGSNYFELADIEVYSVTF